MRVRRGLLAVLALVLLAPLVWRSVHLLAQSAQGALPTTRWEQSTVNQWNNGTLDGLIVSNNADGELRLDRDATSGTYTSAAFEAPFTFSVVTAEWDAEIPAQTTLAVELRSSPNGTEWRDWRAVPVGGTVSPTLQLVGPISVEPDSRWLQYRVTFATQAQPAVPVVREASWVLVDASSGPTLSDQPNRVPALTPRATLSRPPLVITRSEWGAQTTKPDLVPDQPRRLQLSAVPLAPSADPLTLLRGLQQLAIYYGASDLPYAYAVDSAGNVYQGRIGQPAVDGTLSVALLGEPTDAARVALAQTLAWLAQTYDLPLTLQFAGSLDASAAEAIRAAASAATVRARWTFVVSNTRDYTERLMLFNPTKQPASAVVTFLPGQANTLQREYTIAPGQRFDLQVNDIFSDTAELPLEVTANQPIVAERTMLFQNDALNEPGISELSRTWYFAEGDGSAGTSTTFVLYNPQPTEVAARVLVIASNGLTSTQDLVLPPFTVQSVTPADVAPTTFGVQIAASAPIAAERLMRFGVNLTGGFLTRGATAPSTTWYFAEGATIAPFTTTLALLNPGPVAAAITTTFLTEQGDTYIRRYQVPPRTRLDVELRDIVPSPQGVGTVVSASQPIIAERTSYFSDGNAGTNTLGAAALAYTWRFAEGRTAPPADEFIMVANPNAVPAQLKLQVTKDDGSIQTLDYTVPRTGRIAILLDNDLPDQSTHATVVESNVPVVAERTIFIQRETGLEGHTSLGSPER